MTCSEFLAGFSDYYDSDPGAATRGRFEEHLRACRSCERYRDVVARGVETLRSLPPSPLREDFRDRLRHSIYDYEEERRHSGGTLGVSAVPLMMAAAAVAAAVLGGPLLVRREPSVEIPPIVVERPADPLPSLLDRVPETPTVRVAQERLRLEPLELWERSNALLYERSPLYQRYRDPGLVRTGLR
jgi:hypothetical protein